MNAAWIDAWLLPAMTHLGMWSLQWAVLILMLMAWFAVRPPRTAVIRSAAARFVLFTGLALPLVPQFWGPVMPVAKATPQARPAVAGTRMSSIPKRPRVELPEPLDLADAEPVAADPPLISETVARSEAPQPAQPQAIVETPPAREPLGFKTILVLGLASIWVVGVLLQTARLVIGWLWLNRLCRSATAAGAACESELADC